MLEHLNGMGHRVKEIPLENKLYQSQWHCLWIGLLSFLILGCGEPKYTVVSGTVSQNEAVQKGTPITLTDEQGLPLSHECVTDEKGNYRCLVPRLQTTRVMQLQSGGAAPMDSLIVKQKVPTSAITRHINPITNFIAHPSEPNGRHMRTGSSHQQVAAMELEDKVAAYEAQAKRVSEGLGVKADSFASSATFKPRVADDPNSGSVASDLLEVIAEQNSGRTLSPRVLEGVLDDKATHIVEPVTQVRLASVALGRSEAKATEVIKEFSEIVTSSTNENTKKAFQGVATAFGTVKTRVTQDESSRTAKSNHLMELALDSVEAALVESLAGNNKELVNIKTTKDAKNSEKLVNLANNMTILLKGPVAEAVEETANEGKLGYNAMKLLVSGAAINAASVALAANLTEKEPELDTKDLEPIVKSAFKDSETALKQYLNEKPYLDSEKELHNTVAPSQPRLETIHQQKIAEITAKAQTQGVALTVKEEIIPPKISEGLPKISKGLLDVASDAICPFMMDSHPNPAEVTAIDCSGRKLTKKSLDLRAYTQLERLILGNQQLTSLQGLDRLEQLQHLDVSQTGLSSLPDLSNLEQLTYLDWGKNGLQGTLDVSDLKNLTYLNLGGSYRKKNRLTKIDGLNDLKQLTYLNLSYSQLRGTLDISELTNLTRLSLSNNYLNKIDLKNLKKLTFLNLRYNRRLSDIEGLSKLTKLTKLYLSLTSFNKANDLSSLTSLTHLTLSSVNLSNPLNWSKLAKLTYLELSYNRLSGILDVSPLTNLTFLNLAGQRGRQKLTEIRGLNKLTKLTKLRLENNQLSGTLNVEKLTKLTLLNLANQKGSTKLTQIQGLNKLTQLTELYLRNNQLSGTLNVGKLKKLATLNVANNDLTMVQGLNGLKKLTKLELNNNNNFLGTPNASLNLNGLTKLKTLNLRGISCSKFTFPPKIRRSRTGCT